MGFFDRDGSRAALDLQSFVETGLDLGSFDKVRTEGVIVLTSVFVDGSYCEL